MNGKTIIRQKRTQKYTIIPNDMLNNEELSFKAKGILTYLLSKPDNWNVYLNQLAKASKEGYDAVCSGITELMDHGYIFRRAAGGDNPGGWEYFVYDEPQPQDPFRLGKIPTRENPESEKSLTTNKGSIEVNTEYANKETNDPPPERTEIPRETRSFALEEFLTFWQAYPRKVAKHNARRAWEKHQPNLDEVLPALERAKQDWNDPKYIPHPATWINGRRWEDEVEEDQSEPSPLDGREEEFWSWLQATRPWEKRRHTSMIPQKFIDEFLEGGNQRDEKPFVFNNLKQEIATEEGVENF